MATDRTSRRRLGEFFIDLAKDDELLKRYMADPAGVMSERRLHEEHIRAVTQGDVRMIYDELRQLYRWRGVVCSTIVTGHPIR